MVRNKDYSGLNSGHRIESLVRTPLLVNFFDTNYFELLLSRQKLGIFLENKVLSKSKFSKKFIGKSWSPCQIFFTEKKIQKDSIDFWCWKMTLKVQILQSLRRLFIILVGLTMTWFSEKMLIFNIRIRGLMPNLIKKSWTVSREEHYVVACAPNVCQYTRKESKKRNRQSQFVVPPNFGTFRRPFRRSHYLWTRFFSFTTLFWTEIARYIIHFDFTWIEHLINGIFVQFSVILEWYVLSLNKLVCTQSGSGIGRSNFKLLVIRLERDANKSI